MRKRIAALLTMLLVLCALTGCGGHGLLDPRKPVTLTLWHVYGEQSSAPMNRLVSEFNATVGEEKGVVVTVTNVTSASKLPGQLTEAMEGVPGAQSLPDLFSAHTNTAFTLGAEKLVNWEEYFSAEELGGYVPAFLEDGRLDGSLAVFPISKSTYVLYLNGSQFERFSADTGYTTEDLATWDGFFAAAEEYYQWSGGKAFCALDYLIRHIELDVMARGEELLYTDAGWYEPRDMAFRDSYLRFAAPLAQGHIVVSDTYANAQVMTGEVIAGIGSSAAINYYNDLVTYPDNRSEPMELKVLPLPRSGDGEQFMPVTGVGMAAFRTTEQKAEAAALFLRWLTEGQRNLDFGAETGYMPVSSAAFEAMEDYSFPDQGHEELFSAIRTMGREYTPVVRPDFDGYYTKVNALYSGIRERCPELSRRAAEGEPLSALTEELWELFLSVR